MGVAGGLVTVSAYPPQVGVSPEALHQVLDVGDLLELSEFRALRSHSGLYSTGLPGPSVWRLVQRVKWMAEGPITEAVGYILGVGLVAAISLTLWKRD